jgi:hypothetical protein
MGSTPIARSPIYAVYRSKKRAKAVKFSPVPDRCSAIMELSAEIGSFVSKRRLGCHLQTTELEAAAPSVACFQTGQRWRVTKEVA